MSSSTADDLQIPGSPHESEPHVERRSERIKLRRGLTYLGMTLVVPGSAHLASGHRRIGRMAMAVWSGVWLLVLALCVVALLSRGTAVALLTYGPTLRVVQVGLVVLGVAWGALLLDAWRLSRPPELARRHRVGFALLNLAVVGGVVGGLLSSASIVSGQRDLMATVFAGGGEAATTNGRVNILLLGGDAGKGRVGLRPDSLTVASVDADTGRTVLFSLPRNLEKAPFPPSSPMHQKFPRGFRCPDHACMLNAVYTYAASHKELYPGVKDPGARATAEAVEGITGLKINYYVLVDLKGFEALVDAVGGINLDISRRVPIGGGTSKIYGWVEAGRNVHLDGHHALWYARSRASDSDYARIARQKCVMSAMLNQLDPVTVLTKFNRIAAAGKEILVTNIPTGDVNTMLELAMKAKSKPMASLAFVPPLIKPGDPKFGLIHQKVQAKIAAAEAADLAKAAPPSPTASAGPSSPGPGAQAKARANARAKASAKARSAQETDDLENVCSAR